MGDLAVQRQREAAGGQPGPCISSWADSQGGCRGVWPSWYGWKAEKRSLQCPTLMLGETVFKKARDLLADATKLVVFLLINAAAATQAGPTDFWGCPQPR